MRCYVNTSPWKHMSTRHQHDPPERTSSLKDGFSIQCLMRFPLSHTLSLSLTLSSPQKMLKRHPRPARSDLLLRVRLTPPLVAKASLLENSPSAKKLLSPQPSLPEESSLCRDLRNQSVLLVEISQCFSCVVAI